MKILKKLQRCAEGLKVAAKKSRIVVVKRSTVLNQKKLKLSFMTGSAQECEKGVKKAEEAAKKAGRWFVRC